MKKIIGFLAIMAVAVSITSCIPLEVVSSAHQSNSSQAAEELVEDEAPELNAWYGNTFIYKDIAITIPEDWEKMVGEDLEQIYDKEAADEADASFLMAAMDPAVSRIIQVMTLNLKADETYLDAALYEENFLEGVRETFPNDGTIEIESEIRNIILGEHNYKYLTMQYNMDGEITTQYCAVKKIDDEIIMINYVGEQETTIDNLAELFSTEGQAF